MKKIEFELNEEEEKKLMAVYESRKKNFPGYTMNDHAKQLILGYIDATTNHEKAKEMITKFIETGVEEIKKDPKALDKIFELINQMDEARAKDWLRDKMKKD